MRLIGSLIGITEYRRNLERDSELRKKVLERKYYSTYEEVVHKEVVHKLKERLDNKEEEIEALMFVLKEKTQGKK